MESSRFPADPGDKSHLSSRRAILSGLAALGFGFRAAWRPDSAAGKTRGKKKRRKSQGGAPRCTREGEACRKQSATCRASNCLRAPFTIEASWQSQTNHDTWFFVPPQDAGTGPGPQIDYDCNQTNSPCQTQYPFACVHDDARGPGPEITTVYELLPGTYAYWLVLEAAPAAELTVVLKNRDGHKVRTWTSPVSASRENGSWHVFDVDGKTGRVTSVDAPPGAFPSQVTNVCPE